MPESLSRCPRIGSTIGPTSLMASVSSIRTRLDRYRAAVTWLVLDAVRAEPTRVTAVLALNTAGIASAASSMGLVLRYIHWAQKPAPFILGGVTLATAPSAGVTAVIAAAALVMGVGSAALIFAADRALLGLLRRTQRRTMARLLLSFSLPGIGTAMLGFEDRLAEAPSPMDLMNAGGRYVAFALRAVMQLFLPGMTLLVSLSALIGIDVGITVLLAAISVIYLGPLYLINRSVARNHRLYRKANRRVPRALRDVLSILVGTSGPSRDRALADGEQVLAGPEFGDLQDALFGRMLGARTLSFLNACFLIVFVAVILLAFAAKKHISWPSVLAYMVALRFTWSSVRTVTGLLTSFNQIFVEVERVATFVTLSDRARLAGDRDHGGATTLACENTGRMIRAWSPPRRVELGPGAVILALDARQIDRFAIERAVAALGELAGDPGAARPAIVHDNPRTVGSGGLVEHVFGRESPSGAAMGELEEFLEDCGVAARLREMPGGLAGRAVGAEIPVGRHLRYAVGVAYAVLARPRLLALSAQPFVLAGEDIVAAVLGRRGHGITLLLDMSASVRDDSPTLASAVTHVLVQLGRGETMIGDVAWFSERRERIEAELAVLAKERGVDGRPDEDDDEEFDSGD